LKEAVPALERAK
jgi:dynein heavy chain, axonemal